jgi:microcystin-dependent protein
MYFPYLGEIRPFAGDFAPYGWAFCDGRLLTVANNQALFNLLGNRYGGDGQINFALPDLMGRIPLQASDTYPLGTKEGQETVALTQPELPSHNHVAYASNNTTANSRPENGFWGAISTLISYGTAPGDLPMHPESIATTGQGEAHENRIPFTAISYIIALQGVYPPRG